MENNAAKIIDDVIEGFLAFAAILGVAVEQKHEDGVIMRLNFEAFKMLGPHKQSEFILLALYTRGLLRRNEEFAMTGAPKFIYRWLNDFYRSIKSKNFEPVIDIE